MPENSPANLTIHETSEYLCIPPSSIYKLGQEGKILSQKVGRYWRYHRESLERWLQQMKHLSKPQDIPLDIETLPQQ
jgi:excisionase family DNA binding protein